jgi:RimJ/RimL family protein N-acetyltransferase
MNAIVEIRPYSEGDQWILQRTLGNPNETKHLGGSESEIKLQKRHKKYLALSKDPQTGYMFVIKIGTKKTPAGTVGYWERDWDEQKVWEVGWSVMPEYQRQGIATAVTRLLIDFLTKLRSHRYVFIYPSVDNYPSNAICRKLGFTPIEEKDFEYPPGNILHCNIWRLDLLKRKEIKF